jgi:predicted deacylase
VISGLKASSGTKKSGRFYVAELPSSSFSIPLTIINGAKDGPILAIIAGQHGTEYDAIATAIEVIRRIDPSSLSGVLLIVPIVNVLGFETRTRVEFPVDDRSNGRIQTNKIWPGDRNGSLPYLTISRLFDDLVAKSQYFIDLHGGDMFESMTPMTMITKTGDVKIDEISKTLAEVFGFDYIVELAASQSQGGSTTETSRVGIPSVLVEVGGRGELSSDLVERGVSGVLNVMKHLKMIDGYAHPRKDCQIIHKFVRIMSKTGGLFKQIIPTGSIVKEGEKIGEIISMDGISLDVLANASGLLVEAFNNPAVFSGEVLAEVAVF